MKVRPYFMFQVGLILTIVFLSSVRSKEASTLVEKVISNIVSSVPELKKEIDNSSKSEVVNEIVGNGFTTFKQSADMTFYTGVNDSQLIDFLNYAKDSISLPEAYSQYFIDNLSMILFSDFNEIVVYRVLFSADEGGDCKYICIMGQKNENETTDWLIGDVKAEFDLANDVLVFENTKSAAWGIYQKKETKLVFLPKTLSEDQLDLLFKFFEIVVFERFAELLDIDSSQVNSNTQMIAFLQ